MKMVLGLALGILAAIGGFVDIGELVFNVQAGASFRYSLLWAVVLGVIAIIVFAEMSGRVAAVSGRPVFDVVRMRMGLNVGLVTLAASLLVPTISVRLVSRPRAWSFDVTARSASRSDTTKTVPRAHDSTTHSRGSDGSPRKNRMST